MEGSSTAPAASAAPDDLYRQLGHITRQLHDSLGQLGYMPKLQEAAHGLPDARSRLTYIAQKTAEAAHKVLNSVDAAKAEQTRLADLARSLAAALTQDPVRAVASGAVLNFVSEMESGSRRIDHHLTDIMLAQDFHDLTGQVVGKVIRMAGELEDSLVQLLVHSSPADAAPHREVEPAVPAASGSTESLLGPVVDPSQHADVVTSQGEVDDLLASLGF